MDAGRAHERVAVEAADRLGPLGGGDGDGPHDQVVDARPLALGRRLHELPAQGEELDGVDVALERELRRLGRGRGHPLGHRALQAVSGTRSPGRGGRRRGPARGGAGRLARRGGGRGRGRRPHRRRVPARRGLDVGAHDPAVRAGAAHRRDVHAELAGQAPREGEAFVRPPFARPGAGRSGSEVLQGLGGLAGASSASGLVGRAGARVGLLRAELGADLRRGAVVGRGDAGGRVLLGDGLGRAARRLGAVGRGSASARRAGPRPPRRSRRWARPRRARRPRRRSRAGSPSSGASTVIVGLVGLDLHQRLPLGHGLAVGHQPLEDRALLHRVAQLGHQELRHVRPSPRAHEAPHRGDDVGGRGQGELLEVLRVGHGHVGGRSPARSGASSQSKHAS